MQMAFGYCIWMLDENACNYNADAEQDMDHDTLQMLGQGCDVR